MLNNEQIDSKKRHEDIYSSLPILSQIITFKDVELEKLYYVFLVALIKTTLWDCENALCSLSVELDSYKIQYQYTANLSLESGNSSENGLSPADAHPNIEEETDSLSNIKTFEWHIWLELTDEDRVEFYRMEG